MGFRHSKLLLANRLDKYIYIYINICNLNGSSTQLAYNLRSMKILFVLSIWRFY